MAPLQAHLSARSIGHDGVAPGVCSTQHSARTISSQAQLSARSIGFEEGHPSASPTQLSARSGQEAVAPGLEQVYNCCYQCEVSVLQATFPPLLDASDFRSSLGVSSLVQESLEVPSPFPFTFSVPSHDALEHNLVHVRIGPRSIGHVTAEFEAYLSLSSCAARGHLGQRHAVALGMVPLGSGASPRAISRHCSATDSASGTSRGHAPQVTVACLVLQRPARVNDLKVNAHVTTSSQAEAVKLEAKSPGQAFVQAVPCKPLPIQAAAIVPVGEEITVVERTPQDNSLLCEELEKARNELRMQQTLMNFQEKRLRSFEAQSDVARAQEGRETVRSTELQAQLEQLSATVRRQQLEIASLQDQLLAQGEREQHLRQAQVRAQAQDQAQAKLQEQAHAHMVGQIEARDRRVRELEIALQDRERQLDMIPDAVDMILRSPRQMLGDAGIVGAGV